MENSGILILSKIQAELKAPKNQRNSFGNYNYRSCEDILEAVKPLCTKYDAILTISDNIVEVGGKLFIEATATFEVGNYSKSVKSLAMHALEKKGMDASQITGSTSSYARKYALNGLFCIDDNKDSDPNNKDNSDEFLQTITELYEKKKSLIPESQINSYKAVIERKDAILYQRVYDALSKL